MPGNCFSGSLNLRTNINKIATLADIYGQDNLARVIEDAFDCEAFSGFR